MSVSMEDLYNANVLQTRHAFGLCNGQGILSSDPSYVLKSKILGNCEYKEVLDGQAKHILPSKELVNNSSLNTATVDNEDEDDMNDNPSTNTQVLPTHINETSAKQFARKAFQRKPTWHAPLELKRVVVGHTAWVRCLAVDPMNEWLASGSNDNTIKIWDASTNELKVTFTEHKSVVRCLDASARHPYLLSGSEDHDAKCWDLEYNQAVRTFHGHTGGVHCIKIHPTLDLVMTGSKDKLCKVWDLRSRTVVRDLYGHGHAVSSIDVQGSNPQVITGSLDGTVRIWDMVAGKTISTLTHHKKSVRALKISPFENSFVSASSDSVRTWKLPEGIFMKKMQHEQEIINSLDITNEGVLATAGDAGTLSLYDYKTGYKFQTIRTPPQPGSLDSERGIFACVYDKTRTRLFTAEADKTIKVYTEVPNASAVTHPIQWNTQDI